MYLFRNRLKRYSKCFTRLYVTRDISKNNKVWIEPKGSEICKLKIYNHLIDKKVPIILKNPGILRWYICGPTVYDSCHIGHALSYMRFDTIRRILEKYFNVNVIQAMCVTDIDDKIIQHSREKQVEWNVLTKKYEIEFFDDLTLLGIKHPDIIARVTDHIPDIIAFIQKLIKKQLAYISESDSCVYFDSEKYGKCGKLKPHNHPNCKLSNKNKKSASDFVLWKTSKPDEPFWESPWGKGRPGWHTECSTIASKYFGNCVDMHSGGLDLLFPHHENEESQSCAYHDIEQWVNYWIHSGCLHVKDQSKMSKSLNNSITIKEFVKLYGSNTLRMLSLLTNYRDGFIYCDDSVNKAMKNVKRIKVFLEDCNYAIRLCYKHEPVVNSDLSQILIETKENIINAIEDNINTVSVMDSISNLITKTNPLINQGEKVPVFTIVTIRNFVRDTLNRLGFDMTQGYQVECNTNDQLSNVLDSCISFRSKIREIAIGAVFREEPNISRHELLTYCDEFRRDLKIRGVKIKDRKTDSSWCLLYDDDKK